jgi:6-pyruvoyltetrahydropterin/6-carboxytetrahydropterin synthase
MIREIIEKFDHQILLNVADPMAKCIKKFQRVITTKGDPTSELLADLIKKDLTSYCREHQIPAKVTRIRVWESPSCFAEIAE